MSNMITYSPVLYRACLIYVLMGMLLFAPWTSHAQQTSTAHKLPQLTKEEMLEDFDHFIETVVKFSPQTPVRKAVTGIDPLQELQRMRKSVSHMKSTAEFATLIESAITVLQDGHSSLLRPRSYPDDYLKELGISDSAITVFPDYHETRMAGRGEKKFNLKLKYLNGEYYSIGSFDHDGQTFASGWRLSKINGKKATAFVSTLYPYLSRMRWDYTNKRYYSERFYRAFNFGPEYTFVLTFEDGNGNTVTGAFTLDQEIAYEHRDTNDPTDNPYKVDYFPTEEILYIRIPGMNLDYLSFYPNEIKAKAKGKPLKKVIFDIRNNGGGADNVWVDALSAVIAEPIEYELMLLANNYPEVRDKYPEELTNGTTYAPPFLEDYEYAVFASGPRTIDPSSESLNYKGQIYILQNDRVYSSAGAFVAIGLLANNISTVGQNTGWLLGRGINPTVFELPNSKILYRIEPVIDFQAVNSALDVYHDTVEMPVPLTIEDYLKRINYDGDIFDKKFLFNHDPVFEKALKD